MSSETSRTSPATITRIAAHTRNAKSSRPSIRLAASWLLVVLSLIFSRAVSAADFRNLNEDIVGGGSYYSDEDDPATWLTAVGKDWMSYLPGTTKLKDISIPGTHDSGALLGGIKTQCQTWDLEEQLKAGIRYLDIRTRMKGNASKADLKVFHGPKDMQMTFGDVVKTVSKFLKKYPDETVLIDLRIDEGPAVGDYYNDDYEDITPGYSGDDKENHNNAAKAVITDVLTDYASYFYSTTTNQSLKDIELDTLRGKFIILKNNSLFDEGTYYKHDHGSSGEWEVQNKWELVPIPGINPDYTNSEASLDDKDSYIEQYIKLANSRPSDMVMNRIAATGQSVVTWGPARAARRFNETAYKAIGQNPYSPVGIMVMDYPGESLVYRIIKTNFSAPSLTGAKTSEMKSYYFMGEENRYVRYTAGVGVDSGYPLRINKNWSTGGREVRAAVLHDNGKAYFFLEGGYYTRSGGANQKGYPALITDKNWPGLEKYRNQIKAALNWGNGKIYFFIDPGPAWDGRYVRYDMESNRVDQEEVLVEKGWGKLGEVDDDICAALNYWTGKAYFFTEDGKYYRWDIEDGKVDDGYPISLTKSRGWNVLPGIGEVTAAFRFK